MASSSSPSTGLAYENYSQYITMISENTMKAHELGEKIFNAIPNGHHGKFLIGFTAHVNKNVMLKTQKFQDERTYTSIMIQTFLHWLSNKRNSNAKNQGNATDSKNIADAEKKLASVSTDMKKVKEEGEKIEIHLGDRKAIVEAMTPIQFPTTTNMLHLAMKALPMEPQMVVKIVQEFAENGKASFSSLIGILRHPVFNKLQLWPEFLSQCLLLGPLTAKEVDAFAANKQGDEREAVRETLIMAEKWAGDVEQHGEAYKKFANRTASKFSFTQFRGRIVELMRDLRKEINKKQIFDEKAAIGFVKQSIDKWCKTQKTDEDRLLDVVADILHHQPSLKNAILQKIPKKKMFNQFYAKIVNLNYNRPGIFFPTVGLHEVREQYISIPQNVSINFCNNVQNLNNLIKALEKVAKSDYPYVGVDAEWVPYLTKTSFNSSNCLSLDKFSSFCNENHLDMKTLLLDNQQSITIPLPLFYPFTDS